MPKWAVRSDGRAGDPIGADLVDAGSQSCAVGLSAPVRCGRDVGGLAPVVGRGHAPDAPRGPRSAPAASIATDAYVDAQTLLARRACPVLTTDSISGARTGVVDDAPVGIIEAAALEASGAGTSGEILGLDHVVMSSRSRDGALALFGAVLGFDFRLDHRLSLPAGGEVQQLFFRGAGAIVEVLVDDADGPAISLWGLAWTSADIDRSHTRLAAAGVELSPIRAGRKRGTRVFTIRGADFVVPTIVIGHGGKS